MPPKVSKKSTTKKVKKEPSKKFTDKEQRFIEEYLVDFNRTKAAIRAGYSPHTAYSIGSENLKKPEIRAAVDQKLKDLALTSDETLKSLSDIAKACLNDYFLIKERWETPRIKKHVTEVIKDIEAKIEDADKFIQRAKIQDKISIELHNAEQESRRKEIIRLQIELERNPDAYRFENGEPFLIEVAELDMVKLAADKASGKIKSYKMTEFGVNVELYAADNALRDLARIHGLFEKDNKQLQPTVKQIFKIGGQQFEF